MNIKKDTLIRTIILMLAWINQILVMTGHSPIPVNNEVLTETISTIITGASSLWAWWKNNSFTKNAVKADLYLKQLKSGE